MMICRVGVAAICVLVPVFAIADKVVAVEAVASSTAKGKRDKFAAWRAVDGSTGTAWCEGKGDEGLDETITVTLAQPIKVTRLDLYVGLHGSAKEYGENNRPTKVSARTATKTTEALVMLAKATPITSKYDTLVKLDLKTPRVVQVLEIGLAGVTRGTKLANNHSCITDLSLATEKGEVVTFLYGVPVDAMQSLPAAINVLRTAVAGCDAKALSYAVAYPLEHHIAAEEESRTVKHKDVKSLAKACQKQAIPAIPIEADQLDLSPAGFGRVSLETGGGDILRMDMRWVEGSWRLASIETH